MLSATGRSRPFTARADGYARGEGCVVLVLVRERDAPGVPYALLRGSSLHQHGTRASMVGVSSAGQREAVTACLRAAGVEPSDVDYVEAHGGADPITDATEIDALAAAYGRDGAGRPPLFVGSGKANIGYLETAAGGTGVLRAALALCHGELPPQPGFDDPAPAIPWSRLSVRVPTERLPWPGTGPRFAGVNAFGFTGTNAHVLLQAPARARPDAGVLPPRARGERHWIDDYVWH
jgi:acyl transferase domain-containing protein